MNLFQIMNINILKSQIIILFSLITFIIHLFNNYTFYQWPEMDNFPFFERFFDKLYLGNDFFTNSSHDGPNPRNPYQFIIAYLAEILNTNWQNIVYSIEIINLTIIPALIYNIILRISKTIYIQINKNFIFISMLLIILLQYYWISHLNLFGYSLDIFGSHTTQLSRLFLISSLYLSLKKNSLPSFIIYSLNIIGTIIHPSQGLIFAIFYSLIKIKKGLKNLLFYNTINIIVPFFIIITLFSDYSLGVEDFKRIYIELRHPHHYLISEIFKSNFMKIKFGIFILLLSLPAFIIKRFKLLYLPIILVLIILIQYFFTEIYSFKYFQYLSLTKIFEYTPLILIIYYSGIVKTKYSNKTKPIKPLIFNVIVFSLVSIVFIFKPSIEKINKIYNNEPLIEFISKTDKKSLFASDHHYVFNGDIIRLLTKRSVFSSESFPFNQKHFLEYERRFTLNKLLYNSKNYLHIMKENDIDYILLEKSSNKKFDLNLVYDGKAYSIYSIN